MGASSTLQENAWEAIGGLHVGNQPNAVRSINVLISFPLYNFITRDIADHIDRDELSMSNYTPKEAL